MGKRRHLFQSRFENLGIGMADIQNSCTTEKIYVDISIHILDGPVGFRLDWNGRSFVFGGDSYPAKWFNKYATGAELAVHECFFTPEQWMKIAGFPYKQAYWVTSQIHTPPQGFGKLMAMVKPRMQASCRTW